MIKTAIVSQVNRKTGMIKVEIPEEKIESGWLPMGSNAYDLPPIGAQVKVTFEREDYAAGFCHGRYYNTNDQPQDPDESDFYYRMAGDIVIRYNSRTRSLSILVDEIEISGDVSIAGDVHVGGNLHVDGQITEGAP